MTEPAAPHPEDPTTPGAPQVETTTNPTTSQPTDPTVPHVPERETRTAPTEPQPGQPTRPRNPWAEATTNPAMPQSSRTTNPNAPQAETPTGPPTDYSIGSRGPQLEATDPLADLAERIEDLTRTIARQANTIDRLADEAKARDRRDRAGADLPLVLELFALHTDTTACATTAESARERAAFEAIATRIERLITGRGGTLITPHPDAPFDALTMEAAEVTITDDAHADRTVDTTIRPGLTVSGRSVRPAAVVARKYRAG
ncbi:hypothetical protein [Nocardia sp. NPDC052112]|uniref:hypothetical protein n=1 Tax=Nocardia sp. NPDC052112 TaxID=3155646 RepID=UPI003426CAFB